MKPTSETMSEYYVDRDLRSKNAINETEMTVITAILTIYRYDWRLTPKTT
jgi:hypothetical protein